MRNPAKILAVVASTALILGSFSLTQTAMGADDKAAPADPIARGKKVAEDRTKGNCYGCHNYESAVMAGDIGPMLGGWLKQKYKDKSALRAQIWDSTKANPNSMMPPFGKHAILSESEIDDVTEWVWSFK